MASSRKTESPRAARSPAASRPGSAASAGPVADVARQQLATATREACAIFRGFESMRRIQQQAAHDALAHHQAMASALEQSGQGPDLFAAQADLLRYDILGAALYWQQIGAAWMQMQRDCLAAWTRPPQEEESGLHAEPADLRIPGLEALLAMTPAAMLNGGALRAAH